MFEDKVSEEWPDHLGVIVETVARLNIDRVQELTPSKKGLKFRVRLDSREIGIEFYCDDLPIRTDAGPVYDHNYIFVVCRDERGLWDNLLDRNGFLVRRMHFIGLLPDAADDFGECEEIRLIDSK